MSKGCCYINRIERRCDKEYFVTYEDPKTREFRDYCIFHAPLGAKEGQVGLFWFKFWKEFALKKVEGESLDSIRKAVIWILSCEGYVFPDTGTRFVNRVFPFKVYFNKAIFQEYASFEKAHFNNDTTFEEALLTGDVNFEGAKFLTDANFEDSELGGESSDVRFNGAIFSGEAVFTDSVFHGNASFKGVIFRRSVRFNEVLFVKRAHFNNSVFCEGTKLGLEAINLPDYVIFDDSVFKAEADFGQCSFNGFVGFRRTSFRGRTIFKYTDLSNSSFNNADIRGADFSYTRIGSYAQRPVFKPKGHFHTIKSAEKYEPKFRDLVRIENYPGADFAGVRYNAYNYYVDIIIRLFIYGIKLAVSSFLYILSSGYFSSRPEFYRYMSLCTKFDGVDTNTVDWGNNPRLWRDIRYQQFRVSFKERSFFHKYILYPLWGSTSFFGESLFMWLFWAATIITLFGVAYSYGPNSLVLPHVVLKAGAPINIGGGIYLSGLVFTSLGLGGFEPLDAAGRWWILAEVMLGFIMLGSLVSFFANKFVRRD